MLICPVYLSVCPKEAEALAVILGVVGGVLGVGLALLLIWKLLATIQVCVKCEWWAAHQLHQLFLEFVCSAESQGFTDRLIFKAFSNALLTTIAL